MAGAVRNGLVLPHVLLVVLVAAVPPSDEAGLQAEDNSDSRRVEADAAAGSSVLVRVDLDVGTPVDEADTDDRTSRLVVVVGQDGRASPTEAAVLDGKDSGGEDSVVLDASALVLLAGAVREAGDGRASVDRGDSASAKHRDRGDVEVRSGEDARAAAQNGLSLLVEMIVVESSDVNRRAGRLRKLDVPHPLDGPTQPTSSDGSSG